MNIQLPTGKTINVSVYEFLFMVKDEEVDLFFQSCMADDLGCFIEDPFAQKAVMGKLEVEDEDQLPIEEIPIDEEEDLID